MITGWNSTFVIRESHDILNMWISPMDAIVASTGASAESCWIDNTEVTLDLGRHADVLVVDGDPLQDIIAL